MALGLLSTERNTEFGAALPPVHAAAVRIAVTAAVTVEIRPARIGMHTSVAGNSVDAAVGNLVIKTGNAMSRDQDGSINLERLDRPSIRSMQFRCRSRQALHRSFWSRSAAGWS